MTSTSQFLAKILNKILYLYQIVISPILGPRCRFYPSCSCYARSCLEKYKLATALKKIVFRLTRCHPFHPGGVDLP